MSDRRLIRKPLASRFWRLVDRAGSDRCWLWRGARQHPGMRYGKFKAGGNRGPVVYAHRMAYALAVDVIPAGMDVHHSCGTQLCCNPAHLELVPREGHTLEHNTGGSMENVHVPPGIRLEVKDGEAVLSR